MLRFAAKRFGQCILVMAIMSIAVFFGVYAVGNPVDVLIDPRATQEEFDLAIQALGLDQPIHVQYINFISGLLNGEFGRSFVYNEPVAKVILQRMPATLELAFAAMIMAVLLGLPLGLLAGLWPSLMVGRSIMNLSILLFSLPSFWVGLMLITVFAVMLGLLPSTGRGETESFLGIEVSFLTMDGLRHLLLPALNLALFKIAIVIRLTATSVVENMQLEYVRYARAKGVPEWRIVVYHVLRNILLPIITIMGIELGSVIAFAVVTETVFAWPGMGKLIIDSIYKLDRPMIVGYVMVISFMFVLINFVVDLLYAVLDPRIRLSGAAS